MNQRREPSRAIVNATARTIVSTTPQHFLNAITR